MISKVPLLYNLVIGWPSALLKLVNIFFLFVVWFFSTFSALHMGLFPSLVFPSAWFIITEEQAQLHNKRGLNTASRRGRQPHGLMPCASAVWGSKCSDLPWPLEKQNDRLGRYVRLSVWVSLFVILTKPLFPCLDHLFQIMQINPSSCALKH